MEILNTSGRRKTSVARVYMTSGQGNITINDRDIKVYFPSEVLQTIVNQPFATLEAVGKYDVKVFLPSEEGKVIGTVNHVFYFLFLYFTVKNVPDVVKNFNNCKVLFLVSCLG